MGECRTEFSGVRRLRARRMFETEKGAGSSSRWKRDCSQVLISFAAYCHPALLCSSSSDISGDRSHLHAVVLGYFIYADCNAVDDKAVQRITELL